MRVGINLLSLAVGKIGGMEQYIRNLIWYTSKDYHDYELFLFLTNSNFESFLEYDQSPKVRLIVINDNNRNMELYEKIYDLGLQLWFCPLLVVEPDFVNIPTILNMPDIQHEFFPEFFEDHVIEWRNKNFRSSATRANAIITLSQYSKATIVEKYHVSPEKVYPIYLDAGKEFYNDRTETEKKRIAEKYNLPDEFGFFPANTWPHKNHINLLKAMTILNQKYNSKINIVFTGSENQAHKSLIHYIRDNNLSSQVFFLGYIPQDDMPYIYDNASFLAFPSLFEGFGIPLVEAMKTKTPIICSDSGSIPEVVGDGAILFDATNPEDIAAKILMITSAGIKDELIEKGFERQRMFAWESSTKETLNVFEEVFKQFTKKTEDYPLVSIITPSYNQGKFIKETIDSVLNQNYPNIEYIVMDGGSTDQTVDILKSYGDKITWVSEKDGGQADAVNKGINVAKGDIIGWLNSDDTYLPGAIQKAVDFLFFHQDVGMVYGEGYHVKENGEIIARYPTEPFNYERLAENCFICQPTGFFRKKIFEDVGLLDKDLHLCMDYELWMRIGKKHNIAYIAQYLATSRMYEDNKTLSRRNEVFEEIIKTVRNYYNYVPISWVYGYADYLRSSKRNFGFYVTLFYLFIKYNFHNPSYIPGILKNTLKHTIKHVIKQKIYTSSYTGQYEDGWVSKVHKRIIAIPDSAKTIIIKGRHLWPYKSALVIEVKVNNTFVKKVKVKKVGEFSFNLEMLSNKADNIELEFTANKAFNPYKMKINEDRRTLAYIIDEVEIV